MDKSKFKKYNKKIYNSNEIIFNRNKILSLDLNDVQSLTNNVKDTPTKRIRICAHSSVKDSLHEMIIALDQNTFIFPHKHPGKTESIHMIKGTVDLVIFENDGTLKFIIKMGEYNSGLKFYYRISKPFYHMLLINSDIAVLHETTNGPFSKNDTIYAPWAPNENVEDITQFISRLKNTIKEDFTN